MCPSKRGRVQVVDNSLTRLEEAFNVLDRDGDGIIATSDLELFLMEVVSSKLISKEDVQRMLALVDGDVDFEKFLHLLNFQSEENEEPANEDEDNRSFKTMFEVMDRNGDGFVCSDDLRSVMGTLGQQLSDKEIMVMFRGQGKGFIETKVSYEEFVQLMTPQRATNGFPILTTVRSF